MPKKEIKPKQIDVTMDISESEIIDLVKEALKGNEKEEKIDPNAPKFVIHRTRKDSVNKKTTALWKLEIEFINEQRARRNSEYTIKHYQRTFKKLYAFCAFNSAESAEDISKAYQQFPHEDDALAYVGKKLPFGVLESDDFQMRFVSYLSNVDEVGEQTVTSYLRDYRSIMYFCMEHGWIKPFKIVIKDKEAPIKDCYTEKEIDRLLVKPDTRNFAEYRNWVIINYLLATGNRIQTIINIKVGDVDLDEGYININVQKNGKVNRISLVRKMVIILREYIRRCHTDDEGYINDDNYLFCTKYGEKMTDSTLKKAIAEYNKSRGVNKTSIHLFRHTYAKRWIMSGGDIVSLQRMLGQTSNKMVQHYANLYASDIKDKAEMHSLLTNTKNKSGKTIRPK